MHVGCVLLATTRVKHEPLIEPGCIVSKTRSSGDLGEAMWVIGRPSVDPGDIMGVVSEEAAVSRDTFLTNQYPKLKSLD